MLVKVKSVHLKERLSAKTQDLNVIYVFIYFQYFLNVQYMLDFCIFSRSTFKDNLGVSQH